MDKVVAVERTLPRFRGLAPIMPLSPDQYRRMFDAGILGGTSSVEFIDGYLVGTACAADNGPVGNPQDGPRVNDHGAIWPLSLAAYHRMIEADIIGEDTRAEFIEGYLVCKDQGRGPGMGHGPVHATAVSNMNGVVTEVLGLTCTVRCQLPITLIPKVSSPTGSEPEPDLAVAKGSRSRYADHHPTAEELHMVVEVADSSLLYDRRVKASLYAAAAVRLYWILNLVDRQLEVYADADAAAGQYRSTVVLGEDRQVTLALDGLSPVTLQVKALLS